MFAPLKTKNNTPSIFKDLNPISSFTRSPGVNSSVTKTNETRLVRCRHCGFICDTERDVRLNDGSWAGLGINQGTLLTAGTNTYDKVVPSAGAGVSSADTYYNRAVGGGCPCCGSYLYDPRQPIIKVPD